MNKGDLINLAASAAGITKVCDVRFDAVLTLLLLNFHKQRNSYWIRNFPRICSLQLARELILATKSKDQHPAMTLPAFKAGKALKDAVR